MNRSLSRAAGILEQCSLSNPDARQFTKSSWRFLAAMLCCIFRSQLTGVSPTAITKMATALYNGVQIDNFDGDCGKYYKYIPAWTVLRGHQNVFLRGLLSETEI